jgi:protein-S-isoprenylcysteine O-methyltransferase Ste14
LALASPGSLRAAERGKLLTTLLAYLLLGLFIFIDNRARQGKQAKSLERGQYDQGSTSLLSVAFAISALALLSAPLLNYFHLGDFPLAMWVGWIGVVIMGISLLLRLWANMALGAFYTRTLRVIEEQRVIQEGPYKVIRHPGYLGVILMWTGAGLAAMNWVATVVVLASMLATYHYRINAEEAMLVTAKGEEYRSYQSRTWRLIPFVY